MSGPKTARGAARLRGTVAAMEETRFYDDVAAFWAVARDLYEAEPAKHTTALSVIHALSDAPQPDAAPPVFVTLHDAAGSALGSQFENA